MQDKLFEYSDKGESLRELVSTEYCYTSTSAISISLMLLVLISELELDIT